MKIDFGVVDQYLTANDTPGKKTVYLGFKTEEEALKKVDELRAFYYDRGEDFYCKNKESKRWESSKNDVNKSHSIYIRKYRYRKLNEG